METDVTRMAYLACNFGKAHMMIETKGMAYSPCGAVAMAHVGLKRRTWRHHFAELPRWPT